MEALLLEYGITGAVALAAAIGYFFLVKKKKSTTSKDTLVAQESATETPKDTNPWSSVLKKTQEKWFGLNKGQKLLRENLEEALLGADVGFKCSQELLDTLDFSMNWEALQKELAHKMSQKFNVLQNSTSWPQKKNSPHVILIVGVNGVGKTTSIAKLSRELKLNGHSVLLAAGDTFRAAAAEQLSEWAQRLDIPCIKGGENADSSAVLFDAIKAGIARNVDFVICDSAGRLHNNDQLMENLSKNKRVIDKALPGAPHDVVLVLDANTGQNMLNQGRKFLELGLTGLILTKIDGSAKGGAVLPLVQELKIPIQRLGVGESEKDLLHFDSEKFSKALVGINV